MGLKILEVPILAFVSTALYELLTESSLPSVGVPVLQKVSFLLSSLAFAMKTGQMS